MNDEKRPLSLLEFLAHEIGCEYLSDLHGIDNSQRKNAIRILEQISPEMVELRDWNDALSYLTKQQPVQTAETAKAQLIKHLNFSMK